MYTICVRTCQCAAHGQVSLLLQATSTGRTDASTLSGKVLSYIFYIENTQNTLKQRERQEFLPDVLVHQKGIEPPHTAPEAIALSTELQAHLGVPKDTLIYYTILPKLARGNLIYLRTNCKGVNDWLHFTPNKCQG